MDEHFDYNIENHSEFKGFEDDFSDNETEHIMEKTNEELHFKEHNFEENEEHQKLENRISSRRCLFEFNRLQEARFWSRIMQEHALFIKLGLPADQPKFR